MTETAQELDPLPGLTAPDRSIWYDLAWFVRALRYSRLRWRIAATIAFLLVTLACNVLTQIELNRWNGVFFDALSAKDMDRFLPLVGRFLLIVSALLSLVVAQTFLQEFLKIDLRRTLTEHLADLWLQRARPYQLAFAGQIGANPDQRVQEDTRKLAEFSAELGVGLLQQTFMLTTFAGVLWNLSSALTIPVGGYTLTIPGYMVWCALIYAGLGSLVTYLVGRPLIFLNAERSQKEAELRFALVRLSESAESIGFLRGEGDERRGLEGPINGVILALRAIAFKLARLTWVTSGYGWLSLIVPVLVAAPSYFSGLVTFGGLMRLVDAFAQVQATLRWFVDNFARIADWRAALYRVMRFEEELRRQEADTAARAGIRLSPEADGLLALRNVGVCLPDGTPVIAHADLTLGLGERAQISGPPGSGKSTLFRAIAGLWPWGSGVITTPPENDVMFLPARPYLPLGSLREAVCFPAKAGSYPAEQVCVALTRCGLAGLIDQLDRVARWDRELTIGDQQRLTFARLLLHHPRLVFLDEATSALDAAGQADLLRLFDEELAGVSLVTISHRGGFDALATRCFVLEAGSEGSVLTEIRRELSSPPVHAS